MKKNVNDNFLKKAVPNIIEHTQIIHFKSGIKKTIQCIIRIDEGELLKLTTKNGKEFLIPKDNIEFTERYSENGEKIPITKYWYGETIINN